MTCVELVATIGSVLLLMVTFPFSLFFCFKASLHIYFYLIYSDVKLFVLGGARVRASGDLQVGQAEDRWCQRARHFLHPALRRQLLQGRPADYLFRRASARSNFLFLFYSEELGFDFIWFPFRRLRKIPLQSPSMRSSITESRIRSMQWLKLAITGELKNRINKFNRRSSISAFHAI